MGPHVRLSHIHRATVELAVRTWPGAPARSESIEVVLPSTTVGTPLPHGSPTIIADQVLKTLVRRIQEFSSCGRPKRNSPGLPGKCLTNMPLRPSLENVSAGPSTKRKSAVPPRIWRPFDFSNASSLAALAASRSRVRDAQLRSASAARPIPMAGPETAQGPRRARSRAAVEGSATAKPSLMPASPWNLPKERSTTRPGRSVSPATEVSSGATSTKASSTTSSPPRVAALAAISSSVARGSRRPSGLFGLTTTANRAPHNAAGSVTASASCPVRPEADLEGLAVGGEAYLARGHGGPHDDPGTETLDQMSA